VYRIGFLRTSAPPDSYIEAFRGRLLELGYAERKNLAFEYRWAGGDEERLPALALELTQRKVDVIITDGGDPARSARAATRTIPIVMASVGDAVGSGLINSLARPGGNVTGLTSMNVNLGAKGLDLLKDMIPKLSHVAVLGLVTVAEDRVLKDAQAAAQRLRVRVTALNIRGPEDYEGAFRTATRERVEALVVGQGFTPGTSAAERRQIIELAAKNRLPAIYDTRDWADHGGLVSYGADRLDMYRHAAVYVDKILRGAKPADLPIEQPTRLELVVNLGTARKLGLTIPPAILLRADKVIE
jgi:putative ABC transport system substrate-binding protein